ncbi:hypothetical protein ACQUSR_28125 [Streptomyces sp. P1-3]|uniref:hypothetical protein n=1 Tax=Streptomyces sp. P1-3 TaxID=3421658 RepID=UPI003D361D26
MSFPHPGNVREPDAFAAWGGRGAVLLYERDDERFAMLLERVHTSTLASIAAWPSPRRLAGLRSRAAVTGAADPRGAHTEL